MVAGLRGLEVPELQEVEAHRAVRAVPRRVLHDLHGLVAIQEQVHLVPCPRAPR